MAGGAMRSMPYIQRLWPCRIAYSRRPLAHCTTQMMRQMAPFSRMPLPAARRRENTLRGLPGSDEASPSTASAASAESSAATSVHLGTPALNELMLPSPPLRTTSARLMLVWKVENAVPSTRPDDPEIRQAFR